jgi:hypothetical protein
MNEGAGGNAQQGADMTFEGFDSALVIEDAAFWAGAPLATEAASDQADTLDAALRAAGQVEQAQGRADCGCGARAGRAAARAEAMLIDLWIGEAGDNALRPIERPNLAASASWQALIVQAGDEFDFGAGAKTSALRANYIKPQPGEYVDENGNGQYDEGELIIVTGRRPKETDSDGNPWDPNLGDDTGGGGEQGGGPGVESPREPDCSKSNEITDKPAPDGAGKYYVPEDVDSSFLNSALNHILGVSNNNPLNRFAVMAEIIDMYTNPENPFFVDFKDWGTDYGPAGSVGVTWTYFSTAANSQVVGSLFEPFGNYFFGMLCTYGGLVPEEIYFAAAWFSETGYFWEGDDPQDIPHVEKGIADAQRFIAGNEEAIQVNELPCGG